jgi:hypothetical protein
MFTFVRRYCPRYFLVRRAAVIYPLITSSLTMEWRLSDRNVPFGLMAQTAKAPTLCGGGSGWGAFPLVLIVNP